MSPEHPEQSKYKIVKQVGMGGMAMVYEAKKIGPHGFEKRVALKKMLPELTHERTFIDKFISEAKLVAGLCHVNIVQTLDFGVERGNYFIVNEYIDGYTLSQILSQAKNRQDFPAPELVLFIIREVCKGLGYAHEFRDDNGVSLKIIHRDISPGNIMIAKSGAVKINDFGISKSIASEAALTVVGKPAYMSPEQIAQKAIDSRSDLFSLGIIFHEMLARKPGLFATGAINTTLQKVEECVIPPFDDALRVPVAIEAIVRRMLAKEREARFQCAKDIEDAITEVLFQRQLRVSVNDMASYLTRLYPDHQELTNDSQVITVTISQEEAFADQLTRQASDAPPLPAGRQPFSATSLAAAEKSSPRTNVNPEALARLGRLRPEPPRHNHAGAARLTPPDSPKDCAPHDSEPEVKATINLDAFVKKARQSAGSADPAPDPAPPSESQPPPDNLTINVNARMLERLLISKAQVQTAEIALPLQEPAAAPQSENETKTRVNLELLENFRRKKEPGR